MMKIVLPCSLLLVVFASGCGRQPTIPPPEFGDTVRGVMNSQIHDIEAALHPEPDAVEGADPYRLEAVLNVHRQDVARPENIAKSIEIGTE